jgi:hypothetical protein
MTYLSKSQLATILSALDGARRNPANKDTALKAIAKSAERLGLSADDVLAAAAGLLDGRVSPEGWRAGLSEPQPPPARGHQAGAADRDAAPARGGHHRPDRRSHRVAEAHSTRRHSGGAQEEARTGGHLDEGEGRERVYRVA